MINAVAAKGYEGVVLGADRAGAGRRPAGSGGLRGDQT